MNVDRLGKLVETMEPVESRTAFVAVREYEEGWLIVGHRRGDDRHQFTAAIRRCLNDRCGNDRRSLVASACLGHRPAVVRLAGQIEKTYR